MKLNGGTEMWEKIILFIFTLTLLFPWQVYGGSIPMPGMSCEGSQLADGTYIPKGHVKEVTINGVRYRCVGCGGCTPVSSGSSSTYAPSSGLTPSQQMTIGIMGAFLSGFFGSLFSGMFDMNDDSAQRQKEYEEQQRRIAEEKKKEEERKKQLLAQYNQLITQAKQSQIQTSTPAQSHFSFQTLGGQLNPFQWQHPSMPQNQPDLNDSPEQLRAHSDLNVSDLNKILGNVIQDKATEVMEEKLDEMGEKMFEKLDEKYKKTWGSKINKYALPVLKIAVTTKTEGTASAGADVIDEYIVSFLAKPMPSLQGTVAEVGRKIYTEIAFTALDKFLSKTEEAASILGFNFSKEEFMQNFENDMSFGQKVIYKWLNWKGD